MSERFTLEVSTASQLGPTLRLRRRGTRRKIRSLVDLDLPLDSLRYWRSVSLNQELWNALIKRSSRLIVGSITPESIRGWSWATSFVHEFFRPPHVYEEPPWGSSFERYLDALLWRTI